MAALVTTTDLAAYLQRSLDASTATLAVDGASGAVRAHCGWVISQEAGVTLKVNGRGANVLNLPTLLLTAVTAVRVDTVVVPADEYRWTRNGQLYRPGAVWPAWTDIQIDCTHGYTLVPDVVKLVTLGIAARNYGNPDNVQASVVGSVERTYFATQPLDERLLEPYRLP